jgi:hypothetical protein
MPVRNVRRSSAASAITSRRASHSPVKSGDWSVSERIWSKCCAGNHSRHRTGVGGYIARNWRHYVLRISGRRRSGCVRHRICHPVQRQRFLKTAATKGTRLRPSFRADNSTRHRLYPRRVLWPAVAHRHDHHVGWTDEGDFRTGSLYWPATPKPSIPGAEVLVGLHGRRPVVGLCSS